MTSVAHSVPVLAVVVLDLSLRVARDARLSGAAADDLQRVVAKEA